MSGKFEIEINGIGPYKEKLKYDNNINKLKIGIYGKNGCGKTFISRCLRTYEIEEERYYDYAKQLLNMDSQNGFFQIKIGDSSNSFKVSSSNIYDIDKKIDRLFYTFNSDYIIENLANSNYNPNGNIEGYILGKVNIDVSENKKELEELKNNVETLENNIKDKINDGKERISKYNITNRLNKYKDINYEQLLLHNIVDNIDYDSCINDIVTINNVADDIEDIQYLKERNHKELDYNEIEELFNTEYDLSKFEDDFKKYINTHFNFIKEGIDLYNNNNKKCPYCKQELNEDGIKIIDNYIKFVNDNESKIKNKLNNLISIIGEIEQNNIVIINDLEIKVLEMKKYSNFFGSISNDNIDKLKSCINNYNDFLKELVKKCGEKIQHIDRKVDLDLSNVNDSFDNLINDINREIDSYNNKKNNSNTKKKECKELLCTALMNKLKIDNNTSINEIEVLNNKIKLLEKEIAEKELKNKKSKKELVASDLEKYLNIFFNGKYTFNKDTFSLSLNDSRLLDKPDKVLSDGEKIILAFCYYLANIHSIVTNDDDYKKIILVIDDPISSVDIDYIYQMAALIRDFGNSNNAYDRYIILTHNLDFYNVLSSNEIIIEKLFLNKNKLAKYNEQLIMPYDYHLLDIYEIVYLHKEPSYTTPNSIRHILETICNFEGYPKGQNSISKLIRNDETFINDVGLYTYIEDLSHGRVRFDEANNKEMIISACEAVIKYVSNHYPHQIENISKNS